MSKNRSLAIAAVLLLSSAAFAVAQTPNSSTPANSGGPTQQNPAPQGSQGMGNTGSAAHQPPPGGTDVRDKAKTGNTPQAPARPDGTREPSTRTTQ